MRVCKNCGSEVGERSKFCDVCGSKLNSVCQNCGEELSERSRFCPICGTPVASTPIAGAVAVSLQPVMPQTDNLFDFSSLEAGFDKQLEAQAEYDKKLALAKSYAIRERFDEARVIYEELIEKDPMDMNGYMGLIRVETKNYTAFEGANIDKAVRVAGQIAGVGDLGGFDADFAVYDKNRKEYFEQKEAARIAEEKRKAEEARKAAEAARIAEEKRKVEEARIAEEKRKVEEARIAEEKRKAEEARKAEEKRKAEIENAKHDFYVFAELYGTVLKKYKGNDSLVVIPDEITVIGKKAFDCNKTIKEVFIGRSVTSIERSAFYYCENLTNITLPNSLRSIGEYAFYGCGKLTNITIPNNVTSIGEAALRPNDNGCGVGNITVSENNPAYKSIDGVLYSKDGRTLIQYPAGKKEASFSIPNGVIEIGKYAFSNCENLTNITIPNSLTTIGVYAFYSCYGLTNITIPDSVTTIEKNAFSRCSRLQNVAMGKGVGIPNLHPLKNNGVF